MLCTIGGTSRKTVAPVGESWSLLSIVLRHCYHYWYPLTDTKAGPRTRGQTNIGICNPLYIKTQREEALCCVLCLRPYGARGTIHAPNFSKYVFPLKKHKAICSMFVSRQKHRAICYMLKKSLERKTFWHSIEHIVLCSMLCATVRMGLTRQFRTCRRAGCVWVGP